MFSHLATKNVKHIFILYLQISWKSLSATVNPRIQARIPTRRLQIEKSKKCIRINFLKCIRIKVIRIIRPMLYPDTPDISMRRIIAITDIRPTDMKYKKGYPGIRHPDKNIRTRVIRTKLCLKPLCNSQLYAYEINRMYSLYKLSHIMCYID